MKSWPLSIVLCALGAGLIAFGQQWIMTTNPGSYEVSSVFTAIGTFLVVLAILKWLYAFTRIW
jgi:hypothetical protein